MRVGGGRVVARGGPGCHGHGRCVHGHTATTPVVATGIPLSTSDKEYDAEMEEAIEQEEWALHWSGDAACAQLFNASLWVGDAMTAVAEAHGPRA